MSTDSAHSGNEQPRATLSENLAIVSETLDAILKQTIEIAGPLLAEETGKPEAGCIIEELHCQAQAIQRKVSKLQTQMNKIHACL